MQSRSEVDDINLGLEHFYGDFNVVHAQLISSGVSASVIQSLSIACVTTWVSQIKDYAALIDQIGRVLRPGGMVIILEWDFHGYDSNRNQIQAETHQLASPWWPRWLSFARVAVRNSGGSVDAAGNVQSWISNHPEFEGAVCRDYWVPASTWDHADEAQMRMGEIMRDDIMVGLYSASFCVRGDIERGESGIPAIRETSPS